MKQFKFLLIIALSTLFVACQDLKQKKQLDKIIQLEQKIDAITVKAAKNYNDSIGRVIASVMDVEFRIRRNYFSDTIDNALAMKVNEYKMIRKKLKPLGKVQSQLRDGCKEEKEELKKLKTDIQNNTGDASKYDEYIKFEADKVEKLNALLEDFVTGQDKCLESYHRLHNELNAFSFELVAKNKRNKK